MQVSKKLPDIQEIVNMFEIKGLDVQLQHFIFVACGRDLNGFTVIRLLTPDGIEVAVGRSACSLDDNFDKATGTRVAFHRLMSDYIRKN